MKICLAVTQLLNSSSHDPLQTAAQPPLGCDFLVLALPTVAKNWNKIQTHRPRNTMFLQCCYVSVCQYKAGIIDIGLNINFNTKYKFSYFNL